MIIKINDTFKTSAEVGDLVVFKNSKGELLPSSTYLICQTDSKQLRNEDSNYFLMNLNGKKSKDIKFYNSISSMLRGRNNYVIAKKDNIELTIKID